MDTWERETSAAQPLGLVGRSLLGVVVIRLVTVLGVRVTSGNPLLYLLPQPGPNVIKLFRVVVYNCS
jgi:hypothetical protein